MDKSKLHADALKVRARAHVPYSKFFVGAALVDERGETHVGCNFENASYGATICAERNAIGAMLASGGHKFTELVVVTDVANGTPPCGICRQVLAEFVSNPTTSLIHVANTKGIVKTFTLAQLLPEAFDATYLK